MKKLLLILLCLPMIGFGQVQYSDTLYKMELPLNKESRMIEFDEIIALGGVTKNELYSRAREWFAVTFNSANNVIQMDDEKNGKIIGKGFSDIVIMFFGSKTKEMLHFTLSVYVKEERYRIKMNNFSFQVYPTKGVDNLSKMSAESTIIDMLYNKRGKPYKANKTRKEQLLLKSSQIIADLEKSMKIKAKNDDDW